MNTKLHVDNLTTATTENELRALFGLYGGVVSVHLPIDRATAHWRRLSNEVQMLLHDHPVNLRRQQAGQVPVNALWFWGGGALPVRNRRVEIAVGGVQ